MSGYVSEFDQWLRKYKQENPDTESKQLEGRALLWDKRPDQIEKVNKTTINHQPGYVYYPINNTTNK